MGLWRAVRRLFGRRAIPPDTPTAYVRPPSAFDLEATNGSRALPLQSPLSDADESVNVTFVATGTDGQRALTAGPVSVTSGRSAARIVAGESGQAVEIDSFTTAGGGVNRVVLGFSDGSELAVDDRSPLASQFIMAADRLMTKGRRWYQIFAGSERR